MAATEVLEHELISPEEKLRRFEASNPGFKVYRMYDEGRLITNPHVLRSIAEGQEIIAEWRKTMERYKMEDDNDEIE